MEVAYQPSLSAYYPYPGTMLICDFETGFKPPEMLRERPVVVILPRFSRKKPLYTVVPRSTTVPDPVEPFHQDLITIRLGVMIAFGLAKSRETSGIENAIDFRQEFNPNS